MKTKSHREIMLTVIGLVFEEEPFLFFGENANIWHQLFYHGITTTAKDCKKVNT